jgi:5-methylcytosine-specific restriction enzyme A
MHFEIDFLESHDEESLKGELQRVARVLGKRTVTKAEMDRLGRVNAWTLANKFGNLRKAHEAAGLVPSRYTKATDEELMQAVANLWTVTLREKGRRPRVSDMRKPECPVSACTVRHRFGTWKKALIATSRWMGLPPAKRNVPGGSGAGRRKAMSDRKRYLVLKRDRYQCQVCHKVGGELEVDHILPVCLGGSDSPDNLQTLCKRCNRGKGGNKE